MTFEEFWKEHTDIIGSLDIEIENDCDYWEFVTGLNYYHNDNFIVYITGIEFDKDGKTFIESKEGNFEGYLEILKRNITNYKEKLNNEKET